MKNTFWVIFFISISMLQGQIKDPIKWASEIKHTKDKQFEARFTAILETGWHLYSKDLKTENLIPTSFTYSNNPNIKLIGGLQEIGKKVEVYSDVFEANIIYLSNKVEYKQIIEIKGDESTIFEAEVEYQVCDDKLCLPPDLKTFSFKITPYSKTGTKEETTIVGKNNTEPIIQNLDTVEKTSSIIPVKELQLSKIEHQLILPSLDIENPINKKCGDKIVQDESNIWIFIFGFIGGLVALLTPCVYPMIPLTVSYFTKKSENKNKGKRDALLYSFFILFIFLVFTIPFHLMKGINPDIFNQVSTNIWINLSFFVIFIVFAFSFFGYFDLTLPSWMVNKSDRASESRGGIGLFFMALTLVIVSFSCTGPILGSMLANAIQNPTQLTLAFGGCGLAWALVFGGLALSPQLLHNLPKSGSWMNTLKVVLGFIELALAIKFLSKADLVAKTFLLKREIFIAIWVIIAFATVLYLLGFIKFPHDNKKQRIGIGRKAGAIVFILIGVYMLPGLFPAKKPNLKLLSGLTPPLNVSFYQDKGKGVLGLQLIHNYHEAIEIAKKENKPVLVDFTGYGCENCRKMEEYVWSEQDIWGILNNEVIIASLYIDDREELPLEEQITIKLQEGTERKIKTIGNKWTVFQRENFNSNSQPFYVVVTPDNRVLNYPVAGYMGKEDFKSFLQCGIKTFKGL